MWPKGVACPAVHRPVYILGKERQSIFFKEKLKSLKKLSKN